jgi:3-methyladenine DNA glycosylase AlkD
VAKKYFRDSSFAIVKQLLQSKVHEERLLALIILVYKYELLQENKGENTFEFLEKESKHITSFYLKNISFVNNWDLVDTSAPRILGHYFCEYGRGRSSILLKLAKSKDLWSRRVSIVSCLYFIIKTKSVKEILAVAEIVKNDKHDLIHKALGWMLREVYKNVDQEVVKTFLNKNIKTIPRTTLRYAIEKMNKSERKYWLSKR